jgi:hypothetical protein
MAFCIRVSAILGYKQNDALFNRGYVQPIVGSANGAVAIGAAESVEARAPVRKARGVFLDAMRSSDIWMGASCTVAESRRVLRIRLPYEH